MGNIINIGFIQGISNRLTFYLMLNMFTEKVFLSNILIDKWTNHALKICLTFFELLVHLEVRDLLLSLIQLSESLKHPLRFTYSPIKRTKEIQLGTFLQLVTNSGDRAFRIKFQA